MMNLSSPGKMLFGNDRTLQLLIILTTAWTACNTPAGKCRRIVAFRYKWCMKMPVFLAICFGER
jgi:hypothetical protein